jgi:2-dehydropantoate 2-reductase
MKVAVVGAGAVGCYYGARLAQHGHEVHFLLRRDLDHVRRRGLVIKSHHGDFNLPQVNVAATTAEIGPVDVVLIGLKATHNEALREHLPPLLGPQTLLITLQNGLGNEEFLAANWGADRVLGGVCFTCINRTAPGVIEHTAQGKVALGEFQRPCQDRTRSLAAEWNRCGIECEAMESLDWTRWKKLVWNIPFNGLAIVGGGIDTAQILTSPALSAAVELLMQEVIAAAEILGHRMPEDLIQDQLDRTRTMSAYRPSSMIDFVEGREVEVEAIWGESVRRARAAGAACGAMEMLYRSILWALEKRDCPRP